MAGATPPPLPIGTVVGRRTTQGYWRVHNRETFPSLRDTDLLFIDGEYVELTSIDPPLLTLIPAAMFGPPEKSSDELGEYRLTMLFSFDPNEKLAEPACQMMYSEGRKYSNTW